MSVTAQVVDQHQSDMKGFLSHVLEDFKNGWLTKDQALGGLSHVISSLCANDAEEAVRWFREGRKLIVSPTELTYRTLSATWTVEQKRFSERAFERAKVEISRDITSGKLPATMSSFDDLKREAPQAGGYGGLWEIDAETEGAHLFPSPEGGGKLSGYIRACSAIRQRVHEWLRSQAVDQSRPRV
jgi:hypothetical protein